jgi:hypothetical protein
MKITPERRTETIKRICAHLVTGISLAEACKNEKTKVTTFFAWMRKYGPEGTGGPGYPRPIKRTVVLGRDRDTITLGGVGTSFNATLRSRLCASFDPEEGIEFSMVSSSPLAQLSDEGRRVIEELASGIRSVEEADDALCGAETQFGVSFDSCIAADRLLRAFPWLPERIDEPGEEAAQ